MFLLVSSCHIGDHLDGLQHGVSMMVVYHLPRKSGNFGWNVNGKINFVSPNGNFLGKTDFLERYSQTEFLNANVRSICCILLFRAFWLGSSLILSSGKKSWKWNERIPLKISIWDLTRTIHYSYRPTGFS